VTINVNKYFLCGEMLIEFPTHHGGMPNINEWYSRGNARMHCVDMAMGIGTMGYFIDDV
jgi:hypothetical protein